MSACGRFAPGFRRCHARMMKKRLMVAAAIVLLAGLGSGLAQDRGTWRAASNTANSITGDIGISDKKLTINFISFPLAYIRALQPAEIVAAFDVDLSAGGGGNLYRLSVPADRRFMHKNTLCGSDETQWMATFVEGKTLHVVFFSGSDAPVLKPEVLVDSQDVCGTFMYVR
jgi:hypothetical protein